jgi:hypothetical protein
VSGSEIPGSERQSLLIRQYESHTEVMSDCSLALEYNEVSGYHCRPLKDIIAQTYDLQMSLLPDTEYKSANSTKLKTKKEVVDIFKKINIQYRDAVKYVKK